MNENKLDNYFMTDDIIDVLNSQINSSTKMQEAIVRNKEEFMQQY